MTRETSGSARNKYEREVEAWHHAAGWGLVPQGQRGLSEEKMLESELPGQGYSCTQGDQAVVLPSRCLNRGSTDLQGVSGRKLRNILWHRMNHIDPGLILTCKELCPLLIVLHSWTFSHMLPGGTGLCSLAVFFVNTFSIILAFFYICYFFFWLCCDVISNVPSDLLVVHWGGKYWVSWGLESGWWMGTCGQCQQQRGWVWEYV